MNDETPRQLVVVGSSAGGVDALGVLVETLPTPFPAPIVVAQHLDPRRISHLDEILGRRSTAPVNVVDREMQLEKGHVYVVPADRHVEIVDGLVRVTQRGAKGPKPSVDRLFQTAADSYGEELVAVILSGAGSDGAAGARLVKAAGGTVVVQDPATAAFPSMPSSLAPTTVDIVAKIDAIGPLLNDLLVGDFRAATPDEERGLDHFLAQIREQTGIDFASYKRPTIRRRLERRIAAVGVDGLRGYIRYLADNPDEYSRLASTFLIKVTEFFRDPELYEHLQATVIPELLAASDERDHEIRIWSAGCATGEEAYTLAILMAETLGDDADRYNVRIFATDLDNDAINFARAGVYPASALASVPERILDRYFTRSGSDFEVGKQVRAMTVFGQHDLGMRAPFPRIDMVVSRNVLIYFTTELQKRALQLYAFSLRDGGFLVLGKAESVSPLADHFVLEHPRLKIYRRQGERILIPPSRPTEGGRALRSDVDRAKLNRLDRQAVRQRTNEGRGTITDRAAAVLLRLPVGVVIVNRDYDIQLINNAARRQLGIHGTAVGQDFIHVGKSVPSGPLREVIDAGFAGMSRQIVAELGAEARAAAGRLVRIEGLPSEGDVPLVVLTLQDVTEQEQERLSLEERLSRQGEEQAGFRKQLDRLAATNAELLAANDELSIANAELRSANEELLVGSEEVQAATEEMETLNEELQATNEELETLNEELQATVEELNTTNDDLEARTVELEEVARSLEHERRAGDGARTLLQGALRSGPEPLALVNRAGEVEFSNEAWEALGATGSTADRRALAERLKAWVQRDQAGRESITLGGKDVPVEIIPAEPPGSGFIMVRQVATTE